MIVHVGEKWYHHSSLPAASRRMPGRLHLAMSGCEQECSNKEFTGCLQVLGRATESRWRLLRSGTNFEPRCNQSNSFVLFWNLMTDPLGTVKNDQRDHDPKCSNIYFLTYPFSFPSHCLGSCFQDRSQACQGARRKVQNGEPNWLVNSRNGWSVLYPGDKVSTNKHGWLSYSHFKCRHPVHLADLIVNCLNPTCYNQHVTICCNQHLNQHDLKCSKQRLLR